MAEAGAEDKEKAKEQKQDSDGKATRNEKGKATRGQASTFSAKVVFSGRFPAVVGHDPPPTAHSRRHILPRPIRRWERRTWKLDARSRPREDVQAGTFSAGTFLSGRGEARPAPHRAFCCPPPYEALQKRFPYDKSSPGAGLPPPRCAHRVAVLGSFVIAEAMNKEKHAANGNIPVCLGVVNI